MTKELDRLTAAIVAGGELPTLTAAIRERERTRDDISRRMAVLDAQAALGAIDPLTLQKDLCDRLDDWRGHLGRHVPQSAADPQEAVSRTAEARTG